MKDAANSITCTIIKPNNIINIKRALGFCDERNKYIIPDGELDDGPSFPLIHFSVYTYQVRCEKHVIIPNEPYL